MRLRFFYFLFVLITSSFFVSGCIQQIGAFDSFSREYAAGLNWQEMASPEKECQLGNCSCMVCKNGPSIWPMLSSLAGGYCKIDNECTTDKFNSYNNGSTSLGKNFSVRQFMIGQGPSIYAAGAANTLCNGKLSMAVHWLIGSKNKTYDGVDVDRAVCLLDKGVLPVFVLYSKGENINATRAREIAAILGHDAKLIRKGGAAGPAGPVIIVSELEFNSSNNDQVNAVAEQIDAINKACNDWSNTNAPLVYCFAGVAPKIGDKDGLDKVMAILTSWYGYKEEDLKKFVILAYGLNSHYVNGTCSGDRMILDAVAFSRYARNKYGIVSVIPYVLVDVNQPDVSGRCIWREGDAINAYNSIFFNGIPTLIKYGVIGISLYSPDASTFSNPLGCVDCGVVQYEMRKRAWFGNCQKYTTTVYSPSSTQSEIVAIPSNLIRFPNNDAANCGTTLEEVSASIFNVPSQKKSGELLDIFNPPVPEMGKEVTKYWSCDSCISEKKNITEIFKKTGGGNVIFRYKKQPTVVAGLDVCKNYTELDFYASRFNVDPMLVRATAAAESGFDKCAVARVCKGGVSYQKCVPGNYNIGYDFMNDPSGDCKFEDIPTDSKGDLKYTFVGLGLMQVLESPYTFWPPDGPYKEHFLEAYKYGRREEINLVSSVCGNKFNPFNATDAACWGTWKLSKMLSDSYKDAVQLAVNESNTDEIKSLSALVAVYKYTGWWGANAGVYGLTVCYSPSSKTVGTCLIEAYKGSEVSNCALGANGECVGGEGCVLSATGTCIVDETNCYYSKDNPKDFIWFVDCVIKNKNLMSGDTTYAKTGLQRLGYYEWLNENCAQAGCPSWKALNDVVAEYGAGKKSETPYQLYEDFYK
ncbi:MAG: hypothetical protein QXF70_00820 [Candidatus Bilamarchaeaceae archaeon]